MSEPNTLLDFGPLDENELRFEPAPADSEAKVRVERVELKESKAGVNLNLTISIVDFPEADNIWYTVWLPQKDDEAKDAKRKKIALVEFYKAFGVDYSRPVDYNNDLKGSVAWAILDVEEYNGVQRNKIKRWVQGR